MKLRHEPSGYLGEEGPASNWLASASAPELRCGCDCVDGLHMPPCSSGSLLSIPRSRRSADCLETVFFLFVSRLETFPASSLHSTARVKAVTTLCDISGSTGFFPCYSERKEKTLSLNTESPIASAALRRQRCAGNLTTWVPTLALPLT